MANRMSGVVSKFSFLPNVLKRQAITTVMGKMVPFVGTAGVIVEEMDGERVVTRLRNRRKVRNHIRGLHAAGMTLLAETASGFVVGMNLPDDKLPLMKSLKVDFTQRCRGGLSVEATLTDEQRRMMLEEPKGDVSVRVVAKDESGESPIECEMVWAWIPKDRPEKSE